MAPTTETEAALLVIDVQQGFDEPSWGSRNNPIAERNISRILGAWRDSGRRVFHVRHDSVLPNSSLNPHAPGNAVKPEARPIEGEPVYRKTVNSAFIGTSLEADLRDAGVETLILVGLTTPHCVSTSTRMAANLGFKAYVVTDATAAFEQVGFDGRTRSADEVHFGALSDLRGEFATIVDTRSLLA